MQNFTSQNIVEQVIKQEATCKLWLWATGLKSNNHILGKNKFIRIIKFISLQNASAK